MLDVSGSTRCDRCGRGAGRKDRRVLGKNRFCKREHCHEDDRRQPWHGVHLSSTFSSSARVSRVVEGELVAGSRIRSRNSGS